MKTTVKKENKIILIFMIKSYNSYNIINNCPKNIINNKEMKLKIMMTTTMNRNINNL